MIAEARYGFRWHLAIYIIVNLGLVAIWYYTGAGFPWPLFPTLFWGLGVLGHYWGAYHTTGGGWIERETRRFCLRKRTRRPNAVLGLNRTKVCYVRTRFLVNHYFEEIANCWARTDGRIV